MNFSYFGKMDVIVDVITGLLLMISLILSRLVVYNNPHKKYTKEIYEKCGKLNFVLNRSFFLFLFVSFVIVELVISIVMGLLIFLLCSET